MKNVYPLINKSLKGKTPVIFVIVLLVAASLLSMKKPALPVPPVKADHFSHLTAYKPMMDYLTALAGSSKTVSMKMIGKSVQGRDIPALFYTHGKRFGADRERKPVVLVYCQQHGNEPSGKEAATLVARDLLTRNAALLDHLDLILVPQVNPDGGEMLQRRNAHNMDLNRNYVALSEPESDALHELFLKWKPEVTLDVHEYNSIRKQWIEHGYIKAADEMLDGVTNLNIDPALVAFTKKIFIIETGKAIRDKGFTFHRYTVGMPFKGYILRHSTTAINDGRQSMGIYNTLSFIIEGRRFDDPRQNIKHRTLGQEAAILSSLQTVAGHQAEILSLVQTARNRLSDTADVYNRTARIQMDYFPDSARKTCVLPVFDFYRWKVVNKNLGNYYPKVLVKKSVEKPVAYLFSPEQKKLTALLQKHHIQMFVLKSDETLESQFYRIRHVTDDREEEKPHKNVDVAVWKEKRAFPKGSILVFTNQPAFNLIPLLLEPQSSYGIVAKAAMHQYLFSGFLKPGTEYPVARILQHVSKDHLERLASVQ
jgi:hypothetical protein